MKLAPLLLLTLCLPACGQYTSYGHSGVPSTVLVSAVNIQNSLTNWTSCGSTACAGGAGNSTSLTQTTGISSPSVSGASMSVAFTSPATGNNALFINKPVTTCDTCTWARYDIEAYLPTGVANYEYDSFIVTTTLDGMFGKQCNTITGYWQYANQTSGWTNSAIACSLSTGAWHHLIFSDSWNPADTSCSGKPALRFGTVTIDGVTHSWGSPSICATAIPVGWTHTVGCQVQMDSSSAATLTEYSDNVNCSFGT